MCAMDFASAAGLFIFVLGAIFVAVGAPLAAFGLKRRKAMEKGTSGWDFAVGIAGGVLAATGVALILSVCVR